MKNKISFNFGQVTVSVSFIILALAHGVWYSLSLFFVTLAKEFGWSRSLVAGAFSLFLILQSFVGPFVGSIAKRLEKLLTFN